MINKALPAQRILVMRYRFIGDTILAVPFLRNLRYAYPDAVIDVLVGPKSGEVLQGYPYINELITFNTTNFHKYDRNENMHNIFWYAKELRSHKYDLVFVLKRSFSSALLAWLTGAKYRVGYDTEYRKMLLTHPVAWDSSIHEVKSTLQVLEAAGVPIKDDFLEAWISNDEKQEIMKLVPRVNASSTKILIHAAAAHPDKLYSIDSWKIIIKELFEKTKATFFFTGDKQDIEVYQNLVSGLDVPCVNVAGKLSLRQSMALYQFMNLAICVDSGPAHLTAAVGIPTVTLFGPTDPERWRPWGEKHIALYDSSLECRPCNYNKTCNDRRQCLTNLPPHLVIAACLERLQK